LLHAARTAVAHPSNARARPRRFHVSLEKPHQEGGSFRETLAGALVYFFWQNLATNLFLQVSMANMKQYECFAHGNPLGYLEMEIVRLTDIGAKSYEAIVGALVGPDPKQVNKVSRFSLNFAPQ